MSRRIVDFSRVVRRHTALDDTRPEIREERLRCTAGLRDKPFIVLSSWRGRSGRRYVVIVHDLAGLAELQDYPAVAIAVRRDECGLAAPVAVGTVAGLAARVDGLAERHVTEIHVHRLADNDEERRAIILDLREAPVTPPMQQQAPQPRPIVTVG